MCRKGSSNVSRWLFAAGVLIAISMSGIFYSAAACTGSATEPCAQQSPAGWKPVLVEWRRHKARLEALRFAGRVKRHLGREFAKRKLQFARHEKRIERQRRASTRHSKARQFAGAPACGRARAQTAACACGPRAPAKVWVQEAAAPGAERQ